MGWTSEDFATIDLGDKRLNKCRQPNCENPSEASELISLYQARWEIEMFFDFFEKACKIENLQLKAMQKLEVAIASYTVVAWRIHRLIRLGR